MALKKALFLFAISFGVVCYYLFFINKVKNPPTPTEFIQKKNNSIVIFSPSDDTIHAVKANYQHLNGQRTQVYGNFWYKEKQKLATMEWENLDLFNASNLHTKKTFSLKDFVPQNIKQFILNLFVEFTNSIKII